MAAPNPPCAVSCDCLSPGPLDLATGGLYAHHVPGDAAAPLSSGLVALGIDDDGFYGSREVNQVIAAGARHVIASSQSIDRSAEIFTDEDGAWTRRMRSPAPMPTWIGALGTDDRAAWLGLEPVEGSNTLYRLVAGVATSDAHERGALEPAVESHVFAAAPVTTARGVSTTFLLRGIFGHEGGSLTWDRFELIRVSAEWLEMAHPGSAHFLIDNRHPAAVGTK